MTNRSTTQPERGHERILPHGGVEGEKEEINVRRFHSCSSSATAVMAVAGL